MSGNAIYKIDLTKINELQAASINGLLDKSSRAHTVDIVVRKDGVETHFEGDWLKHLKLFCFDGMGDTAGKNPTADALARKP